MNELSRVALRAAALLRDRAIVSARDSARSAGAGIAWAWSHRPPAPRALAIAFAAALAASGFASVAAQTRLARSLPAPLDWAAARAFIERDARPGDAAALSPAWAERAREALPSTVPLVAQSPLAGEDLAGVRRVWLVSLPGVPGFKRSAELELADRAERADPPARVGAIEISRFDLASPTLPLAFLPDRLSRATVSLGEARCEEAGKGRFRCGDQAAVERTVHEVAGAARPCLSLEAPGPLEAPLVVAFPPARLGRSLGGHAGATNGSAAPVRVAVLLDGEEIGSAELPGRGWAAFRIDTSRSAGQVRAISLVVTSPSRLALCLDAMVLR